MFPNYSYVYINQTNDNPFCNKTQVYVGEFRLCVIRSSMLLVQSVLNGHDNAFRFAPCETIASIYSDT